MSKWKPPGEGWAKVNVDGAYDATTGEGGVGVVIRDNSGSVLLTAWKFIQRGQDAEEVEALACAEGLLLAKEWCPPRAVLETDCSTMVKALMMQGVHRSRLKFIIEEAREAGNGLSDWTVVHTRRESNGVAHELHSWQNGIGIRQCGDF
ncbi:hypothetical protein C2845_PM04G09020 [Panicum miliaceum]|uniref:RNase H type-1 domain-containing protein n=1 Tax=Panicum miliaceum TaxID=4540 RepID=A0A3L6QKK4_PANMI|nr:hypothetical protein C2845_PM04G09020 [Panicum miliaceum]